MVCGEGTKKHYAARIFALSFWIRVATCRSRAHTHTHPRTRATDNIHRREASPHEPSFAIAKIQNRVRAPAHAQAKTAAVNTKPVSQCGRPIPARFWSTGETRPAPADTSTTTRPVALALLPPVSGKKMHARCHLDEEPTPATCNDFCRGHTRYCTTFRPRLVPCRRQRLRRRNAREVGVTVPVNVPLRNKGTQGHVYRSGHQAPVCPVLTPASGKPPTTADNTSQTTIATTTTTLTSGNAPAVPRRDRGGTGGGCC